MKQTRRSAERRRADRTDRDSGGGGEVVQWSGSDHRQELHLEMVSRHPSRELEHLQLGASPAEIRQQQSDAERSHELAPRMRRRVTQAIVTSHERSDFGDSQPP